MFYKEFLFVSFDRETARTLGYNVDVWDLLLYLTLGLVIAFAMQFAGVMLVFNFLVLPAVTGLLLSHSMRGMFFVVGGVGARARRSSASRCRCRSICRRGRPSRPRQACS